MLSNLTESRGQAQQHPHKLNLYLRSFQAYSVTKLCELGTLFCGNADSLA